MTLTEIIQADADYMAYTQVVVERVKGTVCISDLLGVQEPIFLQGDEATTFITEAEQLWEVTGHVSMSECHLHLAKPYVDCIWN